MNIVLIGGIILAINIIMIIFNYYRPFIGDEKDKNFESMTLLLVGTLILGGMIMGWFLRLFISEDDDTVIRQRK